MSWGAPAPLRARAHYAALGKTPLVVPGRTVHVEQIPDARTKRAGIGAVHRGLANTLQPADLRPGVAPALSSWGQAQLPLRAGDHGVVVLMRQRQLAEEITAFSEKTSLDLSVDVYAHLTGGYHYVLNAAELVESRGVETTAHHTGNLALALQRCLAQCQRIDWAGLSPQPTRTLTELQQLGRTPAPARSCAILTDSLQPKGYYPPFLTFRNNQPVTEPTLNVATRPRTAKGWTGTLEVTPLLAAGATQEPLRKAWNFSNGQALFILHNRHYLPLARTGNAFRFVGFAGADPGAVSTASYLSGALGGALATTSAAGKPSGFTLDMMTSRVSSFAEPSGTAPADTALIYVYRRGSATPGSVRVLLNGRVVAELGEQQFAAIPYTDKLREIDLCLEALPERCTTFIPSFGSTIYVEISCNIADLNQPVLEPVAIKKGVFDLRVLRARSKATN